MRSEPEPIASPQTWRHPGGKLLEKGANALSQVEVLAVLIGSGVKGRTAIELADDVISGKNFVSIYHLHSHIAAEKWRPDATVGVTIEELCAIPGIDRKKAARILASVELGRRIHHCPYPHKKWTGSFVDASEVDLIAAILGSGVKGRSASVIAQELLTKYGSVRGLFGQDLGGFVAIKGIDARKAIRLCAALEVAHRVDWMID